MLKSGGVRCKYCNEGIYIPLRDVIKRHEDNVRITHIEKPQRRMK